MGTKHHKSVTAAGLLIALGIIYGDIGTSPLYVLNAILKDKTVTETVVLGSLSLVIWTLTLQTTIKYVVLTLKADNRGEGGIFSLYTLVRRRRKWLVFPAMIGGASLLADGMITPPMSVTSAIEGLRGINNIGEIADGTIVLIVLTILTILFLLQQFGTHSIGRLFGPVMTVWFLMLGTLGLLNLMHYPVIFKAFNPYYGLHLLFTYPRGFWILGGVFLCTTGAEALYSDLGHCGRGNIRVSWVMVKTCLILNYLGQGAWLLVNMNHQTVTDELIKTGFNPFYAIMPDWFLLIGIIIATSAAIIASQALVSGSFTLIGEAMRLGLWPRMKVNYPTTQKGQLFLPGINVLLYLGCCGIVLYFRKSTNMEAAYGLAITLCMLATTVLFANYLVLKRVKPAVIYLFLAVYLAIEGSFLFANLVKFAHGGYVALVVAGGLFWVMYVCYKARRIKNRLAEFVKLEPYVPMLRELSNDTAVPKTSTHLVFLTASDSPGEIDNKIIYSIFRRQPKRADIYWFVHVQTLDDPYTTEYEVTHYLPNEIIRIDFKLGFRVQPRIDLFFRTALQDLVARREVNITSRYESLEKRHVTGDFTFVVMEAYLNQGHQLSIFERWIMEFYFWLKEYTLSEEKGFGLDASSVQVELYPLFLNPTSNIQLRRTAPRHGRH